MKLRGLDDAALLAALKSIAPPFDAATERELIALVYGHRSRAVNKAALGVVTKHVKDAAAIKTAFKSRLAGMSFHLVDPKLRALARKDRGQIASALTGYGVSSYGLAFEEDPEFTRNFAPKLLRAKTNELYLTEWELGHAKALRSVPPELCEVRSLEHLDLGMSRFTKLPKELAQLTKLRKLEFQSTPISKPPRELAALPLKHVNVRWSKVSADEAKALWPKAKVES